MPPTALAVVGTVSKTVESPGVQRFVLTIIGIVLAVALFAIAIPLVAATALVNK